MKADCIVFMEQYYLQSYFCKKEGSRMNRVTQNLMGDGGGLTIPIPGKEGSGTPFWVVCF
jgi:hypothetical protein